MLETFPQSKVPAAWNSDVATDGFDRGFESSQCGLDYDQRMSPNIGTETIHAPSISF